MFGGILKDEKRRSTYILIFLVLLDIVTYGIFDSMTALSSGAVDARDVSFSQISNILAKASWLLDYQNILDLLSMKYGIDLIISSLSAFYSSNSFIMGKSLILLLSIGVLIIFKYAPDILPICYGYLTGIALVGIYNGLINMGFRYDVISTGMYMGLELNAIPRFIMTVCVISGALIAFSKVSAYYLSEAVSYGIYKYKKIRYEGREYTAIQSWKKPEKKAEEVKIEKSLLPEYEKRILELALIDPSNDIKKIGYVYDSINEIAEKYGVDTSHIYYDIYKARKNRLIYEGNDSKQNIADTKA